MSKERQTLEINNSDKSRDRMSFKSVQERPRGQSTIEIDHKSADDDDFEEI